MYCKLQTALECCSWCSGIMSAWGQIETTNALSTTALSSPLRSTKTRGEEHKPHVSAISISHHLRDMVTVTGKKPQRKLSNLIIQAQEEYQWKCSAKARSRQVLRQDYCWGTGTNVTAFIFRREGQTDLAVSSYCYLYGCSRIDLHSHPKDNRSSQGLRCQ